MLLNPDSQVNPSSPYRSDVDGLRAVAVLAVMVFHAFPTVAGGGFVGVDVFFVLSGYLISSILIRANREGAFSILEFYVRRIIRIFPSLLVVLATCLALGFVCLLPGEYRQLAKHTAAGAGFISNFAFWRESGYFDASAETKPLLHLWSLGIEEQFYIVWPMLVWASMKLRWRMLWVSTAVLTTSFILGLAVIDANPVAAFYSPLTRIWELACGGALASLQGDPGRFELGCKSSDRLHSPPPDSTLPREFLSIAGLSLLLVSIWLFDSKVAFPGWRALPPVTGTLFLISAGDRAWLNRTFLSNRLLVGIGLISYPLYLWHWPILSFSRIACGSLPPTSTRTVLLTTSLALAWLTYWFVEVPIRFGRLNKRRAAVILLAALTVVGSLGAYVYSRKGLPRRFGDSFRPTEEISGDWEYPAAGMRQKVVEGVTADALGGEGLQTLFYGDSNIQQYAPRIAELLSKNKGSQRGALFLTTQGGLPVENVYRDDTGGKTDTANFLRLAESPLVDRIVIGAAWGGYFSTDKFAFGVSTKASYHLGALSLEQSEGADAVFEELEKMVRLLISKGKRVVLILGIPSGNEFGKGQDALESREFLLIRGGFRFYQSVPRSTVESRLRPTNERLSVIAARTGAQLIQPLDALCPGGICPTIGHKDSGHLRASYVRSSITYLDGTVTE